MEVSRVEVSRVEVSRVEVSRGREPSVVPVERGSEPGVAGNSGMLTITWWDRRLGEVVVAGVRVFARASSGVRLRVCAMGSLGRDGTAGCRPPVP
jgi:hypothetical protein